MEDKLNALLLWAFITGMMVVSMWTMWFADALLDTTNDEIMEELHATQTQIAEKP